MNRPPVILGSFLAVGLGLFAVLARCGRPLRSAGYRLISRLTVQLLGLLAAATTASGVVLDSKVINIDLTRSEATNLCEWFPRERYAITKAGLGWEGTPAGQRINGGEIVVYPIAVGFCWRPARSVRIRAEILPGPEEAKTPDGKPYWRNAGQLYARYSPDRSHWSTWQPLSPDSRTNRVFAGRLAVPGREREEYERLRVEYANREDVRWSSDEEGAVQWMLERDPEFFAHHLPFIGYVQFLFEGEFVAGYRFKSIKVELSFAVGGLHVEPKDEQLKARMWSEPWRFRGSSAQRKTEGPPNGGQFEEREIKTGWHTNETALRNLAWGPPASNGLRAACYLEPSKDAYAVGEQLARYRVFHNGGKEPVFFKIRGGGNDDQRTAFDEQGQKVPGAEIEYSTIFPRESFRLEPGQIVEMKCFYSTLLVPWQDERQQQQRNVDWYLWAKSGRVYRAYWKLQVSVAETDFVLQTGEAKLRIISNDMGTR